MSWKVRHQGSPKAAEGLTLEQVVEGMKDGIYERNAEVQGPGEKTWVSFEAHPLFEEMAMEMEDEENGPGELEDPEEQRIDMNPLIDVCLVLLVFFILATTMQVLEKVLDIPHNKIKNEEKTIKKINKDQVDKMVFVKATLREGRAVYEIDKKPVAEADLIKTVQLLKKTDNKSEMIIDATGVDWGSVVKVIDAAAAANIKKVHFVASGNIVKQD